MRGLCNGIQEALIGIWREIDGDMRARRYGTCYLNIQVDFAIRAIRSAGWSILPTIYRNACHHRQGDAQLLKVRLQVAICVAASQFHEGDTLATSIIIGRTIIKTG